VDGSLTATAGNAEEREPRCILCVVPDFLMLLNLWVPATFAAYLEEGIPRIPYLLQSCDVAP